ncbi:MAG: hypothetical protein BA866_10530 [Desulfobulbaceae bacterium S5133MH15]|nr:MAG: hypothetical protein BA866_10530 [Desulfobulbaceae bacterium S5133MH15]
MKKIMMPLFGLVVAGLAACETMPESGAGSTPAIQHGTVSSLKDLVGARGRDGEDQMVNRGYTWARTDKSGGSAYSYWREKGSGNCVSVRTSEGRYKSIVYTPGSDCQDR